MGLMKTDITFPTFENIFIAAVQEYSEDFGEKVWFAYLINDSDFQLDAVMIVSKAFGTIDGEMKKTSLLRHAFVEVEPVSFQKIELIYKDVLALNNEFMVTFFIGETLYDRKFIFRANSITPDYVEEVPLLFVDGVIVR
jgi:energy-converting hydrogenase Eha subunit E